MEQFYSLSVLIFFLFLSPLSTIQSSTVSLFGGFFVEQQKLHDEMSPEPRKAILEKSKTITRELKRQGVISEHQPRSPQAQKNEATWIIKPGQSKREATLNSKTSTHYFTRLDSLPFKLLEFKATKKDKPVLLEWQTADEQRSDKFIIEQSRDGQEFISIGQVEARGTSSIGPNNYIFLDKDPAQGNNYYRLIMIDKDGTYNYTTVQKIYNGVEQVVTLYRM